MPKDNERSVVSKRTKAALSTIAAMSTAMGVDIGGLIDEKLSKLKRPSEIHIPKSIRKGKTPEEIQALRERIYQETLKAIDEEKES